MNISSFSTSRNLSLSYWVSFSIVILMGIASLTGLIFQTALYPTDVLRQSFVPNDAVNLLIGLPILSSSIAWAKRGKLIGSLFWLGALFCVIYNYIAYAIALPLTIQFVVYLALIVLSVYAVFLIIFSGNVTKSVRQFNSAVPARLAGGVLIAFGTLFFFRSIAQVIMALFSQMTLTGPALGVLIADLLITPLWVIGGILLWHYRALGYVLGTGLLFQACMLFIDLLALFIFQPFLASVPFPTSDFVVIFLMGMICFVSLGLLIHGILSREN